MDITQWAAGMAGVAARVVEAFGPDATVERNAVGNLMVRDAAGEYVGWVDVAYAEMSVTPEPAS